MVVDNTIIVHIVNTDHPSKGFYRRSEAFEHFQLVEII